MVYASVSDAVAVEVVLDFALRSSCVPACGLEKI